jgi:hypothetical protein
MECDPETVGEHYWWFRRVLLPLSYVSRCPEIQTDIADYLKLQQRRSDCLKCQIILRFVQ